MLKCINKLWKSQLRDRDSRRIVAANADWGAVPVNLLVRLIRFSTLIEQVVQSEVNARNDDQAFVRPALAMTDISILLALADFAGGRRCRPRCLSVSELVNLTGCPRTRVSMQLKKLRDQKLVDDVEAEYRREPLDRRERLSRLSTVGKEVASDVYSKLDVLDRQVRSAAGLGNQKHLPAKLPALEQVLAAKV